MRKFAPIAVFAFALLCGGCATHTSRTQEMRGYWRVGEAQKAYAQASELGGESGDADELVWLLEEGAKATRRSERLSTKSRTTKTSPK